MADRADELGQTSPWWAVVAESGRLHETTAQLFERVEREASRLGLPLPSSGAVAFNRIRAMQTALAVATERLTKAPPEAAITSEFIAQLPYGEGLRSPAGPRMFHVRVAYTYQAGGEVGEDYVTLRYTGGLPPTVEALRADAEVVTAGLMGGYGRELIETGDIQIGEL